MRTAVATVKAFSLASTIAVAATIGSSPFEPVEAKSKLRSVVVGGAAAAPATAAVARNAPPAAAPEQQVASADRQDKTADPLANLNVSPRTKELQERADRILAENGETRKDEADVDTSFATEPAPKPLQPSKAKELAAGIQCIAGCD